MNLYNMYPDIMTTDDVCEILNISKNHCLNLLRSNSLKGFKISGKSRIWKITKPAIIQFISGRDISVRI